MARLFVDEPRPQDCFCETCGELFYGKFGKDLAESVGNRRLQGIQAETVGNHTRKLCKEVKSLDPIPKTTACVAPCGMPKL